MSQEEKKTFDLNSDIEDIWNEAIEIGIIQDDYDGDRINIDPNLEKLFTKSELLYLTTIYLGLDDDFQSKISEYVTRNIEEYLDNSINDRKTGNNEDFDMNVEIGDMNFRDFYTAFGDPSYEDLFLIAYNNKIIDSSTMPEGFDEIIPRTKFKKGLIDDRETVKNSVDLYIKLKATRDSNNRKIGLENTLGGLNIFPDTISELIADDVSRDEFWSYVIGYISGSVLPDSMEAHKDKIFEFIARDDLWNLYMSRILIYLTGEATEFKLILFVSNFKTFLKINYDIDVKISDNDEEYYLELGDLKKIRK
jgi:hypothetical protein